MLQILAAKDDLLNFTLTLSRYQASDETATNYFESKEVRNVFTNGDEHFLLSLCESNDGVALSV